MKCIARVPNKWFHFQEGHTGADHQCPNKAKRDGYCHRHHPSNLLPIHQAKFDRLSRQLEETKARIEKIRAEQESAGEGINPS
jgi:hypothetical protein